MAQPVLDGVELQAVQQIDGSEREAVEAHAIPGLEGDFLQDLGRRATRISLKGVLSGPAVAAGLESLRKKFRSTTPVSFVADIGAATKVDKVLIEELGVRELAGKPRRFEYALTLREFIPPPAAPTQPPPPPPPPPVVTNTATLVVEVIVTGQPGFDFSTVKLTVDGTRGDGRPFSARTLTGRNRNLWTEPNMPAGSFAATAVVTGPPAMSGSASATLRAGATTKVTITLTPLAAVATRFLVSFRFDKAFVEPCMRHVLRQAVDFGNAHPDQKLLIVGDTDLVGTPGSPTGPDPYNQSLSERRARAVFAFVTFGRDPAAARAEWSALRARQTGATRTLADNWGPRQAQSMLQDLGFYPGRVDGVDGPRTHDAIRAFRRSKGLPPGSALDDPVWDALIPAYLGQDNFAVPAARCFTNCPGEIVRWIGVASQDPQINTRHAERRNRRVELLFVNVAALPCQEPQPDTFALPAPGAVGAGWCIGPGSDSRRACFAAPYQPPGTLAAGDQWTRVPAEPGTLELDVLIEREVRQPDGSVVRQPAGNERFVVITPLGEYLAAELSSGKPQPARTDAGGSKTFADKPLGIYTLEVFADVLVRLDEDGPQDARGNAVCKHLTAADHTIHVVILADPPLREVRLPAAAHLMTALHPLTRELRTSLPPGAVGPPAVQATAHTPADAAAFFAGTNDIWRQARVHFDLVDTVEEVYAFRDEGEVDANELIVLLQRCAYPNLANAFFFGDLTGSGELGMFIFEPPQDPDGVALSDRFLFDVVSVNVTADESTTVLAHELGHFLSLPDLPPTPAMQNRLMMGTNTVHRLLVPAEVTAARASRNGGRDFTPLRLTVAGATQAGGTLSHEFIAVAAPGLATITAVVADGTAGTVTLSGGTPVDATHQTVDTTSAGPPVTVSAVFAPAGGGENFTTQVEIRVVTFDLDVAGATRISPTVFVAKRTAGGTVTVIARLVPPPFCIPKNLIAWSAGSAKPDPLRRAVPVAAAGSTAVSATLAGTTRSLTIVVAEVTLGALVLVGKNLTVDVPVTIAPTPLPGGLAATLRIGPTSGSGEARFASSNSSTTTLTAGGTVTVRGISASSVAGNLRLSATVGSAPDLFAQRDFSVVDAAIGPFTAVGSGQTIAVPITVTPSPLPAGSSLTLTLSSTSGTGAARFANGLTSMTITQTTTVTIAGVTPSSVVGNLRLAVTITGQTGVLAQRDFTVLGAIRFFLRFEVWNLVSRAFEPLPAGVAVDLIDDDPIANDLIATQPTDANGRVLFNLADFSASGEATPDLFFLVHTIGRHHAAHVLPAEWSTKGWTATDGTPGFLPDFAGTTLGTDAAPVVFRVGLDVHAKLTYRDESKTPFANGVPAPQGCSVELRTTGLTGTRKLGLRTDADGEVHGVAFDVSGGDSLELRVDFSILDPAIHLRPANVSIGAWDTGLPSSARTSLGTQTAPFVLDATSDDRNKALFFLKSLRELSVFLFHLTGRSWPGFDSLTLFRSSISGVAYSWPVGSVNIPPSDHWKRDTLIHEITHQTMWQLLGFSSADIAFAGLFGDLSLNHAVDLLANPLQALIEGWAEFVEAVFAGVSEPPYNVATVFDSSGHNPRPLGPPPANRGESVEGAFADGLWTIFENHVVTPAVSPNAHVVENAIGDVTVTNPWILDPAVQARFQAIIWNPFIATRSGKTSSAMIAAIRAGNPALWPALQADLQRFNMGF